MTWHVDADALQRYASLELAEPAASSVEAHLTACDACRREIAGRGDALRLERVWTNLAEQVDAPRRTPVEWVLVRLGVRDHTARLLAATSSLHLSWLLAVVLILLVAVWAGQETRGAGALFLLAVPVLPLAGVAGAYGRGIDPSYEIGKVSPTGAFALLLVRAVAAVTASLALAGVASLALGNEAAVGAVWLLPALALSAGSLALATVMPPGWAAATLASLWVGGVLSDAAMRSPTGAPLATSIMQSGAFDAAGQILFALMSFGAVAVLVWRHEAFDFGTEV